MTKRLLDRRSTKRLASLSVQYAFGDKARYYSEPDLSSLDNAGQPTETTDYEEIDCNFTDKVSSENWIDLVDAENIQAEIRLKAIEPNKGGRFELMKKFNLDLATSLTYEIVGIKNRGEFGYVCALKVVIL